VLVGFAAETEEVIARPGRSSRGSGATSCGEQGRRAGAGFGGDTNRWRSSRPRSCRDRRAKEKVAEAILDWIVPVLDRGGRGRASELDGWSKPRPVPGQPAWSPRSGHQARDRGGITSFPWIALRKLSRVEGDLVRLAAGRRRRQVRSRRRSADRGQPQVARPVASARAAGTALPRAALPGWRARRDRSSRRRGPARAGGSLRGEREAREVLEAARPAETSREPKSCRERPKGSTEAPASERPRNRSCARSSGGDAAATRGRVRSIRWS